MAVFTQYWYWYPYLHFLSLALTPTALIGLNHQLKVRPGPQLPQRAIHMPYAVPLCPQLPRAFTFRSEARPSLFAYPPPMEIKKAEEKKKVKTATLSVTAKAQVRPPTALPVEC